MIRSNSKVYKFKICIDGYTLDYAQKYIDKNILNKYHYVECQNSYTSCDKHFGTIIIYDKCMNNKIIDLCISFTDIKYYWTYKNKNKNNNNQEIYIVPYKLDIQNKYIAEIYDNIKDVKVANKELIYNHIYDNILNYNLINILIKNICKDFFVEYIDISLTEIYNDGGHRNKYGYTGKLNKITVIDTITIIIDETKSSNNRKIKIYKEFNEFYQNRDDTKNYQIIKDINNLCIIEELDNYIDKDAEIEKLKKENEMLKKFYI